MKLGVQLSDRGDGVLPEATSAGYACSRFKLT